MRRQTIWGSAFVLAAALLWATTGTAAAMAPGVGPLAIGAAAMGVGGLLQAAAATRSMVIHRGGLPSSDSAAPCCYPSFYSLAAPSSLPAVTWRPPPTWPWCPCASAICSSEVAWPPYRQALQPRCPSLNRRSHADRRRHPARAAALRQPRHHHDQRSLGGPNPGSRSTESFDRAVPSTVNSVGLPEAAATSSVRVTSP